MAMVIIVDSSDDYDDVGDDDNMNGNNY